nr:hypothetical protein Iba_chr04fCG4170 [Ipomoea batatas]
MDKINLPETLDVDPTTWELRQTTPTLTTAVDPPEPSPEELVHLLHSSSHREYALSKLAKEVDISIQTVTSFRQKGFLPGNPLVTCNAIALFRLSEVPREGMHLGTVFLQE